jgi:hypothetical protein
VRGVWGDVDDAADIDCGLFLFFVLLAVGAGAGTGAELAWRLFG